MKRPPAIWLALVPLALLLIRGAQPEQKTKSETRLRNLRQLTFGGENAEAYFSFDGAKLIFQSTREGRLCDQIYTMNLDGSGLKMVSTGKGRTTCGYFLKDGKHFIYSSTHLADERCPPKPDFSKGYVWAIHDGFDIFRSDGEKDLVQLTHTPGYDAEGTVSPDGKKIVFTSVRDGDLEIYSMNIDGTEVTRLTHTTGYDGGAFFSPDGKKIVYRAFHPGDEKSVSRYKELLAQGLIEPRQLELFVMGFDGSNQTQITRNRAANFCPFFHPNGKQIIFSSNLGDPQGRNFDLYLINLNGTGLEQITYNDTFDGFPMFSPDGKELVFASNRNGKVQGETNIFVADWVE